jgi:hypothetical protein
MTSYLSPVLAQSGQPLLGNQWLALFVILGSVTAFLLAIAAVGRWLAATHPAEPAKPAPTAAPAESAVTAPLASPAPLVAPATNPETSVEVFAAIAAAVAVTLGARARVLAINAAASEPVAETSRLQWSMEGRRQIYSSHKVR